MKKSVWKIFFLALFSVLAFSQCAKIGSPTGGPKDETAPKIVSSNPENEKVNFDTKRIEIKFDELIKFKDLKKQLIVSPPMKNELIIKPQSGASDRIRIEIKDTLKENTTYTINFGNSIQDNNEGNPYKNFRYVFSTGQFIDSLSLDGIVENAFIQDKVKEVSVLLYRVDSSYTDSVVYNGLPTFLTNTIESDTFKIENANSGKYQMIALFEKSSNYRYDPGQDLIAFYPDYITLPDTNQYKLRLFEEEEDFSLRNPIHSTKGKIIIGLGQATDDLIVERVFPERTDSLVDILEFSENRDSIFYWFNVKESDSIKFKIASQKRGLDTVLNVNLKKQKDPSFTYKFENKSSLTPDKRIEIISNFPILDYNADSISVMNLDDSTKIEFSLSRINNTSIKLDFEPKYGSKYQFEILPGAFHNLFNVSNDTIAFKSIVKEKSSFGEIDFDIQGNVQYPVIVDLIKEKAKSVTKSIYLQKEGDKAIFTNLDPGKYNIRLIFDKNANGKWDTGNFLKRIQPEEVKYYDEVLELKANWEIQQSWILK